MNRSWQFSQLRFHIFFFIGLEPPQDYDRPIRRAGGVLFKILGRGLRGPGGVKLATKKRRNIIGVMLRATVTIWFLRGFLLGLCKSILPLNSIGYARFWNFLK